MAKKYWLVKSEPSDYSFDDLTNEEDSIAEWDGVRNYQARNNMQAMKAGDEVLFYHSQTKPPAVVGLAEVVEEAYPDDTAWDPDSEHPDPRSTPDNPLWFMVDIQAKGQLCPAGLATGDQEHAGTGEHGAGQELQAFRSAGDRRGVADRTGAGVAGGRVASPHSSHEGV